MTLPKHPRTALLMLLSAGLWFQETALPALAETKLSKQVEIQANGKMVSEIRASFDKAEKALKAQDLDGLMALYSKDYDYHGLTKNNLLELWKDLFSKYRRIASHHIFSKIVVTVEGKAPKARITCTGGLWATAESTGERIIIDSWFEEVHRLVYEDGAWRILGHDGEDQQAMQSGAAHPYF
ncbi:MAG TPA: hypothetical protein VFF86_04500 [Candidatus Methylomirabilis sp.]|nr:hypothetical protein [Candidatus Methylomirabilis sp.]